MANIVILAEYAAQVTVGQKDGSRAADADQWLLLPEVGVVGGDLSLPPRATKARLAAEPVYPTLPGTQPALVQHRQGLIPTRAQFSGRVKFQIGRNKLFTSH